MPRVDASAGVPDSWLHPVFTSPRVRALMSTREGGVSTGAYAAFNPRPEVGDNPQAVRENRRRMQAWTGLPSRLLRQVHGIDVSALDDLDVRETGESVDLLSWGPEADACWSARSDRACEIQVADCLPVLFADREGRAVAAAHAGWRGLAAGVLEATASALTAHLEMPIEGLEAWLGPCIGPTAFEVGSEVRSAFTAQNPDAERRFVAGAPGKWWADLAGLARDRLERAGVGRVFGNDGEVSWCTHSQPQLYNSYRRDRDCGRMAALIWLQD